MSPSTRAGVLDEARKAHGANVDLVVFPELTLSSYAIDDLLLQDALLDGVERAVAEVIAASAEFAPVLVVGRTAAARGASCIIVRW